MWQTEVGCLEMLLAYHREVMGDGSSEANYRDFLFEILCCHQRSLQGDCMKTEEAALAMTSAECDVLPSELEGDLEAEEWAHHEKEQAALKADKSEAFALPFVMEHSVEEHQQGLSDAALLPFDPGALSFPLAGLETPSAVAGSSMRSNRVTKARERRYLCRYCPKRFTDHSNRAKHERVHTKERPYACALCGKTFTQVSHRNRHERGHLRTIKTEVAPDWGPQAEPHGAGEASSTQVEFPS